MTQRVRETFVSIVVADMARATKFYVTTLGAVILYATPQWTSLAIAGVRVGLFALPTHPGGVTGVHFVVDDLAAAKRTIEAAGGAVADAVEVAPGVMTAEATDSEGNRFTLRAA